MNKWKVFREKKGAPNVCLSVIASYVSFSYKCLFEVLGVIHLVRRRLDMFDALLETIKTNIATLK